MAAVELAEQPLGLGADGVRRALVEERSRRGVGERMNRRAVERGQAASRELGVPVHAAMEWTAMRPSMPSAVCEDISADITVCAS